MTKKRKTKKRSKGLGDTVEKFTEATGIKKLVKWIAGEDCGCDKRKEKLNQLFKYKSVTPKCLNESEYLFLKEFFKTEKQTIQREEHLQVLTIYNRVFKENRELSNCASCVRDLINETNKLYETYKEEHNES